MSSHKSLRKKRVLAKKNRQTRGIPAWAAFVHRHTSRASIGRGWINLDVCVITLRMLTNRKIPELSVPFESYLRNKDEFIVGSRSDGRNDLQHRTIYMKTGTITQASGSAYIEAGNQKIVCAVYGPHQYSWSKEVNLGTLNCDLRFLPMSCFKRRPYLQTEEEKVLSNYLYGALTPVILLEALPRSVIDVYINVIESDGISSTLANAVTCSSLALANAGIEMRDLVVGCSLGIFNNGSVYVDPSGYEESFQSGSLVLSYMPQRKEIANIQQVGEVQVDLLRRAADICTSVSSRMLKIMAKCLKDI